LPRGVAYFVPSTGSRSPFSRNQGRTGFLLTGTTCSARRSRTVVRWIFTVVLLPFLGCAGEVDVAPVGDMEPVGEAPPARDTVEAVDDGGRVVRLGGPARRVLSLLPATTETVAALGAAERLVGRTDYDEDAAYAHLPSVGGGLTPSVEAIAALRPDLVIAWEEAGTARIRPRLEALGVSVFGVRTQDTTAIFANVARLGHLLGLDDRAESLAAAMRAGLDSVRVSVADRSRPSVLYMIGVDPPIVAGPNVFIGQIVEIAGGRNVFDDLAAPSPQVSVEEIVRRKPEVVIIPTDGDLGEVLERLRSLAGWRDVVTGGEVRVETIPIDLLHRPGPGITRAARALRDVIHRGPPIPR
jgi:ABC-type Fe3+-hydroxamate transport system substrate-binding protein